MRVLLSCFFVILTEVYLENTPLVLGEILGLFFNTLTAYDKYPVQDCENLPLPVQMQLSEKSKGIFSIFFFFGFLEST